MLAWCDTDSDRVELEPSRGRDFWKLRLRFNNRPQVATFMLSWSGRGILPCCRKIFFCRRSFGRRVIMGFKNLICMGRVRKKNNKKVRSSKNKSLDIPLQKGDLAALVLGPFRAYGHRRTRRVVGTWRHKGIANPSNRYQSPTHGTCPNWNYICKSKTVLA